MAQLDSSDTGNSGSEDDSNTEDKKDDCWEEEGDNKDSSSSDQEMRDDIETKENIEQELSSPKMLRVDASKNQKMWNHGERHGSKSSSSSSSSDSGSGSSSDDQSGESESDTEDKNPKKQQTNSKYKEDKKVWEENPDIYGIRRSNRQRKEPDRISYQSSGSENGSRQKKKRKKDGSWIPTLSGSESEQTDSSYDVPQRKQTRKARKQRGRPAAHRNKDKYDGKKTNERVKSGSQRNLGSTVSYKEDSDDETDSDDIIEQEETANDVAEEDVETIERIVRHRRGWSGQTGAQTTVYSEDVEEIAKLGDPDPEENETELQFLIKWKSWSHLHSTWETKDGLAAQNVKGQKKLDNYIKRMEDIDLWKKNSSPEDVEYYELQQEMNEDIQKQYQKVERIIAHKFTADSSSGYPDYLCKWQGLPYFECTWEDGSLTARYFQKQIDDYLERERSDTIPNKNAKCLRQRPKFTSFKTQPDFIGSEELRLRDYQVDGVNWLVHAWCRNTSVILADEMGLGKTIQSISFLSYLFHKYSLYGPFLAVVPLSTMDAWQREFALWGPDMNVIVYLGDVNSRTTIQEFEWCFKKTRKLKFNVLLTTYEMLLRDKELLGSLNWSVLLIDEAHRLKNEDSLLYRVLIDFKTNFRFLITGTPLQNSLKELWSLLHFLMPNKFDNWDDFESEYSVSDKEGLQKLHRDLEPFLLRRVKKDVEKSLPAKVEQILRVEMSQIQKQYYRLILTRNVQELCRELKGSFSGLLNIVVELKKCCNHSSLIKPLDFEAENTNLLQSLIVGSGKMILLDKLLSRLKETGHRVLIFSQMVRMLDIIADYLVLKRFPYQRLDGSVRGELRKRALDHFNAEGSSDFCFLLSTRAGGLGINLATADTVIIFDSDWNPQNDLQAMARAHRIGQKNQVNIYRFVTKNTIEENIIERAKKKMVLDHLIIQRMDTTGRRVLTKSSAPSSNPFNKEELSSILKFGAEDLFKDHDQDTDSKLHAMDIDEILQRAETQETQDDNAINEDLLSQFKVVNYAAFNEEEIKAGQSETAATPIAKLWEEIIPADERAKVEAEKLEELTLKPRNRKTVEKMNSGPVSKKIKSKEFVDDDFSSSSSEDEKTEDAGKKKTTRQKPMKKEGVKGFTDSEIRRFIKSYKKFARPTTRLDAISEDAELTDKSTAELHKLCLLLKSSCEQAIKEYEEKLLQDDQFDGKKKGASLKISGVSCNAHTILKAENDLEPLAKCLPEDQKQLKNYRLTIPTRSVHWGVSWGNKEDSMLLVGMLSYGMGNWEAIKNDHSLELTNKILPKGNEKPQQKHLLSRGEYLLRLLKEHSGEQPKPKKQKLQSKRQKQTASDITEQNNDSKPVPDEKPKVLQDELRKKEKKKKKSIANDKEEKVTKKKKKKDEMIQQSTTSETKEGEMKEMNVKEIELSDVIFKQCKEKMRTEKKSLQLLHQPDQESSEQSQVQTTKKCLLKIGDHIEEIIKIHFSTNQHLSDTWRSNLWSFVAKFTELGASKLFKLYRTACRKRDAHKQEIQKMKASHTNSLHEVGKNVVPHDRLELEEARRRALGLDSKSASNKIPKLEKKIPSKKADKHRHQKMSHQDSQPWDFRKDHKDSFSKETESSKVWNNKYNNNTRDSNSKIESKNAMTYREWKELKEKRVASDEKPFNDHHRTEYNRYHNNKKYHQNVYDEKPPDKYYEPRRSNYSRDRAHEHAQFDSPRTMTSTSQSPTYFTERMHNSRKRTYSNNSDSVSSMEPKKPYNDFEQVSPEPGEIT